MILNLRVNRLAERAATDASVGATVRTSFVAAHFAGDSRGSVPSETAAYIRWLVCGVNTIEMISAKSRRELDSELRQPPYRQYRI